MRPLVDYVIAHDELGPIEAQMYEYVFGRDGVHIRAERDDLEACIPIASADLRGLGDVPTFVRMACPRVPEAIVADMLALARKARIGVGDHAESLFYLWFDRHEWELHVPQQLASAVSVRPKEPGGGPEYAKALIEVHSHHRMQAYFSSVDNEDETGFRLFGVLGQLFTRPQIRLRVGVFGNFYDLPASNFLELTPGLECAVMSR